MKNHKIELGTDTMKEITQNAAKTKKHLKKEREHADKVIRNERARLDSAISHDSTPNVVTDDRRNAERSSSDRELASERLRTDLEIDQTAESLQVERTAHQVTKTALTSREELLAIVSHDLRNPIGTIQTCSDMLLLDDANFGINSEVRSWLTLIRRNANSALRLVSDLLDIERFAIGKFELDYEVSNLVDVVRQAAQSFTADAATKSILIRVTPPQNTILLNFDRHRITQVLSNLVGNAIKFTAEGGMIILSANQTDAGTVEVSVNDNGVGIPEDKKETIFQRFSQLGIKDRRGLGLGLYISKSIVEAHGGRLWVESQVGSGSTFYFSIPTLTPK